MVNVFGGTLPQTSQFGGTIVAPFKIGKHEITYGQWREVVNWANSHGYEFGSSGFYENLKYMGGWSSIPDNYPVVGVSWDDCAK